MQLHKIGLEQTGQFGKLFLDYISEKEDLREFYLNSPTLNGLESQLSEKTTDTKTRELLSATLQQQYGSLPISKQTKDNIKLLKESNTFTVTTGHQLNIFTGPLYFIYKIVSTINLAKTMQADFPDYNFVPVYWMASEDHDFEEISITHIGNHDIKWTCEETGAVGRFSTETLRELTGTIPGDPQVFQRAYSEFDQLADSVRYYVNELFGNEGIVVIEPDDRELKRLFKPVIEDDIFQETAFKLVGDQISKLESLGYSTPVNPREINFFYLKDSIRERIIHKGDRFVINNTDISFSGEALQEEINQHPERFSPNVIMRPLYQEWILPNIAYLGGPSEVIYWLEYKTMFEHYDIPLPVLLPRNFALFIDRPTFRKLQKTTLTYEDLFKARHKLEQEIVVRHSQSDLSLDREKETIQQLLGKVRSRAAAIDTTLDQMSEAETKKILNHLDRIEKKMLRAEKRNQETLLQQIDATLESLFPKGKVQERYLNFLTFYFDYPDLLQQLLQSFDPLDFTMNILVQDE